MGIKTRFNPMGGSSDIDKGNISEWVYSNVSISGEIKTLLYKYNTAATNVMFYGFNNDILGNRFLKSPSPIVGKPLYNESGYITSDRVLSVYNANAFISTNWTNNFFSRIDYNISLQGRLPDPLYVPKGRGKTIINDWVNMDSGTSDTNRKTPFYNNREIVSVDLQKVPFVNNSMFYAFNNCTNLQSIRGINPYVTNMIFTFNNCTNLKQITQIPNSVTNMAYAFQNCTIFNQNIQIPNSVTNMAGTFQSCYGINQNIQIPNSVTTMAYTFTNCINLNQNIKIPNSVTNMAITFQNCLNLNQNIQILNSVTNMEYTFSGCTNLNQNIQISNLVEKLRGTFRGCTNLNQNIQIPNSVTNMEYAFTSCRSLNQNIQIPNSVTTTAYAFYGCYNLNQSIQIPNSVINMRYTFYDCIQPMWVNVLSSDIADAINCFGTSTTGLYHILDVYLATKYINNANTISYNSFNTAGWKWAEGTVVGAVNSQIRCWSPGYNMFNAISFNGTHCCAGNWWGVMDTYLNHNVPVTETNIPFYIESYQQIPLALYQNAFTKNTILKHVNLADDIAWVNNTTGTYTNGTTYTGAFSNCTNLISVSGRINRYVTKMDAMFRRCVNLTDCNITFPAVFMNVSMWETFGTTGLTHLPVLPQGVNNLRGVALHCSNLVETPQIPSSASNLLSSFADCPNLTTVHDIPNSVIQLFNCFNGSPNISGYINIHSSDIAANASSNIGGFLTGHNAQIRLNVQIPYLVVNNYEFLYSSTYNQFNANAFYRNNATSNVYLYDISPYNYVADYVLATPVQWAGITYLNKYRGLSTTPVTPACLGYIPFKNINLLPTTYNALPNLTEIDCNNVPFSNTSTLVSAFAGDYAVTTIKNLNIPEGITNAQAMFSECRSLKSMYINLPTSCTIATTMFLNCKQLTNVVLNAPGLTTLTNTFAVANGQNMNIFITSPAVTGVTNTFRGHATAYRKNIYIYYKYSNGAFTSTYTKFNIAQYAGTSGLSNSVSPKYNSTSNFYVYDLSEYYQQPVDSSWLSDYTYTQSGSTYYLNRYTGTSSIVTLGDPLRKVKIYPDDTEYVDYGLNTFINANCYNEISTLQSIDLQGIPFVDNSMSRAFQNCTGLVNIYGINSDITDMTYTFRGCISFNQNISIPNSVTNMAYAFEKCHNFSQKITIPNSVTNMAYAFQNCYNLKGVTIPQLLSNIEDISYAFDNCISPDLDISNMCRNSKSLVNATGAFRNTSITSANYTFSNCSNIVEVGGIFDNCNNLLYMVDTFANCYNLNQNIQIPNSVTNMVNTFIFCYNLNQNIQIPNSVTNMYDTFYNCTNLNQNIQIPNSVTNMQGTFRICHSLNQNIKIPNLVGSMAFTFAGCYNLNQNIQIPNSVVSMWDTFGGCHNLNYNIQIPNSVESMAATFSSCHSLNYNIQIPNSVTNMASTFENCHSLNQNIRIPNLVTNISSTFENCYNLNQNIQIPNSVTNMVNTFRNCTNLNQNIQIPNSVINMRYTFANCTNLSSTIVILSEVVENANNFTADTSLPKNVYIPYKYSANTTNSKTFNSFMSAGYIYSNGVSKNTTGVKIRPLSDLNS